MKLIQQLFGKKQEKNLRHFLGHEFKVDLKPLEMPNVGTYRRDVKATLKTVATTQKANE